MGASYRPALVEDLVTFDEAVVLSQHSSYPLCERAKRFITADPRVAPRRRRRRFARRFSAQLAAELPGALKALGVTRRGTRR
jgi:hypothetical protein